MHLTCSLTAVWAACLVAACFVRPAAGDELADLRAQTQKRVYKDAAGKTLLYRLFVPKDYAARDTKGARKKYALILFLHGAGERGNDNAAQLRHPDVLNFVTARQAAKHPAFLVAPQCPTGEKWVDVNWGEKPYHKTPEKPSEPMRLTLELMDALQKEFPIDADRVYVTGLSMGGYGTLDALVRRPDYWAAAVPLCGGADNARAKDFAHVPIWVFHGSKDGAVPVERSRSIVEALKKAGGSPKYTEYEGEGHGIWKRAYAEPELAEWLFQQKRKKAEKQARPRD